MLRRTAFVDSVFQPLSMRFLRLILPSATSSNHVPRRILMMKRMLIWCAVAGIGSGCAAAETAPGSLQNPAPEIVQNPASGFVKKSDDSYRVIVFVHGIFGDQRSTWLNRTTGRSWPEMIAEDPRFESFDVYSVGFDSPYVGRSSNIVEIAGRVRDQLARRGIFDYPEVYFITHSMGGLITKRMLVDMNTPAQEAALRRVKGVLLYSTPSQGAPVADLARWLSQNPQLDDMRPANVNTFLQGLEWQWEALLREREERGIAFPRVYCAYETKGLGIDIVNRLYAQTRCDNQPYAFDLNHFQIVKPASPESDIYDWARARIEDAAARIDMTQRGREEGAAVGFIRGRLRRYHEFYGAYPETLGPLEVEDQVRVLGPTRVEYALDPSRGYVLRFAGQDRVLNTVDDQVYSGASTDP